MSKDTGTILIIGLLVVFLGSVIIYHVMRFMRGRIRLNLLRTAFQAGDPINGSLEMTTRRPIEGRRLFVALIGYQETRIRNQSGKQSSTRTELKEIYRDEQTLEQERPYPPGFTQRYEFQIQAPTPRTPGLNPSAFDLFLSFGNNPLTRHANLRWKIEARLDAKGVDLAAEKRILIHGLHPGLV